MSPQIIELLLFAGLAFFLVSKLLSVLGTTNETDNARQNKSFFGEPAGMKDVTAKPKSLPAGDNFADVLANPPSAQIVENINLITERVPSFDIRRFVEGAKGAFKMLIDAIIAKDDETLTSLVDRRFLEEFNELSGRYGNCLAFDKLIAKVSESYMFGNNAFVKVLFTGNGITSKLPRLAEEWTFTKTATQRGPDWYLSNIEMV